jgi:hypothetical protein
MYVAVRAQASGFRLVRERAYREIVWFLGITPTRGLRPDNLSCRIVNLYVFDFGRVDNV